MLVVRPARLDDEDVLRPIHLATWTADVSPGPDPDPSEPVLDDATLPDVLVAEDDRVLGDVHESCGFTVEGVLRREFRLNGEDVDDLLMARRLDEA